jgi:hypothetical protein
MAAINPLGYFLFYTFFYLLYSNLCFGLGETPAATAAIVLFFPYSVHCRPLIVFSP